MTAHVLYGDSFLVTRRLAQLRAESGADDLLDANRHHFQAAQAKPEELLSACGALPFLDSHRLVVVEGLLATLERRSGRGRGQRNSNAATNPGLGGWNALIVGIPQLPDSTLLVFIDGPLSDTNPLLSLLRPLAEVQNLKAPSNEALARWIKDAAQQKGSSISPAAIRNLANLVGNDLWTLDRDLEKLSLYAFGRSIEESDVQKLVSQVREANIFNAVDAVVDNKPGVALRLLQQLREDGQEASSIIGLVERQLRLMALARDLMDQGIPQQSLGSRLGLSSQFVIRKTVDQARRHPMADIVWRYQRLLETDLAIKRGRLGPDLALELLVADQVSMGRD